MFKKYSNHMLSNIELLIDWVFNGTSTHKGQFVSTACELAHVAGSGW